jgi:signal transduction histidine kinase
VTRLFASLRGRLAALFVALAAIAAVAAVLGAAAFEGILDARRDLVDRVDPAVTAATGIVADVVDQETGVRGYALAGRDVFLQPYRRGIRDERADGARLRAATAALDGVPPLVDDMLTRAARWRRDAAEPTIARARTRRSEALDVLERGKVRFDEFRAAATRLRAQLAARRVVARQRLQDQTTRVETLAIISGGLLLALGIAAWFALRAWVTVPLEHLGGAARRVGEGDIARPIRPEGPLEIALLATEMEDMRERIVRELSEVKRSNAELEQFAYVASHDLQEPLRQVASFCTLLERRYGDRLDDEGAQYLKFIVDGAQRMQRLIEDLLAFSRVGRAREHVAEVDLETTLDDALRNLTARRRESGAEVTRDPLPVVVGDASLLTTLWQNLIGNAIKFHGAEPPRVHVSCTTDGAGAWALSVRDNGIGLAAEHTELVFDIFERLHPEERYEGTGIGLAMCRKIVESHGGTIAISGNVGAPGATVRFTLPRRPR